MPLLEHAVDLSVKKIMDEMQKSKEHTDKTEVKIRYLQSIEKLKEPTTVKNKIFNSSGGE